MNRRDFLKLVTKVLAVLPVLPLVKPDLPAEVVGVDVATGEDYSRMAYSNDGGATWVEGYWDVKSFDKDGFTLVYVDKDFCAPTTTCDFELRTIAQPG